LPKGSGIYERKDGEGVSMTKTKRRQELVGWGFIALPVILISIFVFYPMVQAFILSFQSGMGINIEFAGFGNYTRLFRDASFFAALRNTLTYLVIQVPIMIMLALVFSVLLNRKDLKGRGFFRTAIFLPAITSLVAYATVFGSIFGPRGLINALLESGGFDTIGWLTEPSLARATIIIGITWRWTGYNMIFYLASLQNIDESIYEAARIDGATGIQQFFRITIPMLKPIILFTSIMSTIGTLQLFDEADIITGGGPGNATMTIAQHIHNNMFGHMPSFGYAATISFVVVIIIIILSAIQFIVGGDRS